LYEKLEVVTELKPTDQQMQDLILGWKVAKFVKSNAIVYARDAMILEIGSGRREHALVWKPERHLSPSRYL
jgi:phosphoribosylaminoimidazolecarboxamide formyltransferase/IMP cyclohydrolase